MRVGPCPSLCTPFSVGREEFLRGGDITCGVTGTPIQNVVLDLWPLVKMVGVEPFNNPELDVAKDWFKKRIANPLKHGGLDGVTNLRTLVSAELRLYSVIQVTYPKCGTARRAQVRSVTLRRMKGLMVKDKTTGLMRPLVQLPIKTVRVVSVEFLPEHRALYDTL
jgi:SNF2 family DNA or RNA helicase